MAIGKGLAKLQAMLKQPAGDYRPEPETFPPIDVSAVERRLRIKQRAAERGKSNLPATNTTDLDDVEQEIASTFHHELMSSNSLYMDEQTLYDERLQNLNFQGQFAFVDAAVAEAVADFRIDASNSKNSLTPYRIKLRDSKDEIAQFKIDNKLRRAAHYPSEGRKFLQFGLIALLFFTEAVINGAFLRKGGGGWIGGTSTAIAFAFVNILFSAIITHSGVRQLFHRNILRKLFGLISLGLFAVIVVGINTVLAIYRELSADITQLNVERAVIDRIRSAIQDYPAGLAELYAFKGVETYILLLVGIIFAIIVLIDVLALDDLYPGYGKVDRQFHDRLDAYSDSVRLATEDLQILRNEAVGTLNELKDEFAKRREEYEFVLERRRVFFNRFKAYIIDLQAGLDALVQKYRSINRQSRADSVPGTFNQQVLLQKLPIVEPITKTEDLRALNSEFERIVTALTAQSGNLHQEYEKAARSFPSVDEILSESSKQ